MAREGEGARGRGRDRSPLPSSPFLVVALSLTLVLPAAAQPDTTAAPPTAEDAREVSPGGALRRSLLVPGWGQLYNRDYVKVPVVVGGLGAFVGGVVVLNQRTTRYRRAAIFADCTNNPDAVPPGTCDGAAAYEDEWTEAGSLSAAANRSLRDTSRRNRDLLVLLSVLAYGLQALDAYVSAELADFDVSEDLSLRLTPAAGGAVATLRWDIR